jgi:phosphatidate cytidylyltransferase
MRTLITRSISGVLLVALVTGAFILGGLSALLLMLVVFTISFLEFKRMFKVQETGLFALLMFLGLSMMLLFYLILTQLIDSIWIIGYSIVTVSLITLYSLFSKKTSFRNISLLTLCMIWIAGASIFVLATGWKIYPGQYSAVLPIVLLSLIWINDAGAYLAGSLFGKRQFSPIISPGKTWEGFISGIVFTGLGGWIVFLLTDTYSVLFWIIAAIITSLSAVAGDLFESKLKREADVKDSGKLIPGHGGMLDRFDSLFFSAPIFYGLLILWEVL